jgi:hypothetical protein
MNPQLELPRIRPGLPELRAPADRPFNAIRSYLKDQSTLAETIDRLASPIDSYYDREFDDLVERSLHFTWQTFNAIMVQMPHDNTAWHTRLAEILIGLSERPSPSDEVRMVTEPPGSILWADLPYYSPDFVGGWLDAARVVYSELGLGGRLDPDFVPDHDLRREQWTRSNAFVARLVTKQCKALDYEVYAIHTMRAALEDELHADELWINVPAAAVWVFHAGNFLFRSQREWVFVPEKGNAEGRSVAYGGPLWQGKTGSCIERWDFWKERFGVIVEREDVDEDTRSWADSTKRKMEEIQLAPLYHSPSSTHC